jgi:hypothetical protein
MSEACPRYADVIARKKINDEELVKDLNKLKKWKPTLDGRCFAGNDFLYHFQLDNLCKVKLKNGSFKELMSDDSKRNKCWELANKYANGSRPNNAPMRLFEMWRRLNGAIVFFRPTIAKYIYKELGATHVLDPTAGWGGRLIGAWSLDIDYTGFDTNEDLVEAYQGIVDILPNNDRTYTMNFENSLAADFTTVDYDCVLTSPPYVNLEMYPGMSLFESKAKFYKEFLIPLIDKCLKHIKRDGWVCFNISPKMYKDLLSFGYKECVKSYDMKQQKVQGIDKGDKIYCWRNTQTIK